METFFYIYVLDNYFLIYNLMNTAEIIQDGYETFGAFLEQFEGPHDIYKQILVEELIKLIYEEYYKKPWDEKEQGFPF